MSLVSPVTYHRLTSDPYKESGSSIPRSGLCSFPSTSRINQLPGSSLPGAKPSACPRPLVSAVGSPSQSSGTGRYGCLGSWVRRDGLKCSPLVRIHPMRSDRGVESATRQRFAVLTDQSCRWSWRGCALTHQQIQSSRRLLRRYRSGLINQRISRVESQASRTPRAIETSASTTGLRGTSAGAGPQYAVLIKD